MDWDVVYWYWLWQIHLRESANNMYSLKLLSGRHFCICIPKQSGTDTNASCNQKLQIYFSLQVPSSKQRSHPIREGRSASCFFNPQNPTLSEAAAVWTVQNTGFGKDIPCATSAEVLHLNLQLSLLSSAPYIIIQCLVIQLLQLCLVIPELDSIQHLRQQQNQGVFVPMATEKTAGEW